MPWVSRAQAGVPVVLVIIPSTPCSRPPEPVTVLAVVNHRSVPDPGPAVIWPGSTVSGIVSRPPPVTAAVYADRADFFDLVRRLGGLGEVQPAAWAVDDAAQLRQDAAAPCVLDRAGLAVTAVAHARGDPVDHPSPSDDGSADWVNHRLLSEPSVIEPRPPSPSTRALDAARASADRAAQAHALIDLGRTHFQRGDYLQATDCYGQALTLARELDDHLMVARALGSLATAHCALGRYGEAIKGHRGALEEFRDLNDQLGEVINLSNLGLAYFRQGCLSEASSVQQQALALCRDLDDQYGVVYALNALGEISCHQGQYEQAESYLWQSLQVCRPLGAQSLEAVALTRLADVHAQQHRAREATTLYRQALAICRQTGSRDGEADALIGISHILVATGQITQAREGLTTALTLARQTRDPYQQARALQGLAAACHAADQHDQAREHEQQAGDIHAALGITHPATSHTQPPGSPNTSQPTTGSGSGPPF